MAFDKNHTSTAQKVVIVIFSIILVGSLCLPFFSSCTPATGQDQQSASTQAADEAASTVAVATVEGVRARYSGILANLESRLEADPQDTTAMASLGNNYMDMAGEMEQASDAADNHDAVIEAYDAAIGYYDMYLDAAHSDAVRVDRAVCLFYSDRADEAIADLEDFVAADGSEFAMAWFNLGVMHYGQQDYEASIEAFAKAVELDPDGSMGVGVNASFYQSIAQASIDAQAAEETSEASAADEQVAADEASQEK